jgi:hypothetical protein
MRSPRSAQIAAAVGSLVDAAHAVLHVGQRAVEGALSGAPRLGADLVGKRLDARVQLGHRAHDLLGAGLDLGGQVLDRIGDDTEAAPRLAGALGLDRGVERHQPRLQRDLRDAASGIGHLAQRRDDRRHLLADAFDGAARALHRAQARLRGLADRLLRLRDLLDALCQREHGLCAALRGLRGVVDHAAHLGGLAAHRTGAPGDRAHSSVQGGRIDRFHCRLHCCRLLGALAPAKQTQHRCPSVISTRAASRAGARSTGCAAGRRATR